MEPRFEVTDEDLKERANPSHFFTTVISYILVVIIAVFCGVFINSYVLSKVQVDGTSMVPTLHHGQSVWILKTQKVKCGDIVVFPHDVYGENKLLIKRLIAMEGDTVYSEGGKVMTKTADGAVKVWHEGFTGGIIQQTTMAKDQIFVMGDNINTSLDSTESYFGEVFIADIVGKAIFV